MLQSIVRSGDQILLLFNDERYIFGQARVGNRVQLKKSLRVDLGGLIGHRFGQFFEVSARGDLKSLPGRPALNDLVSPGGGGAVSGGQLLTGDGTAQRLGADDIEAMRAEGREGQEIIRALVQGSSSFKDRTSFSQEKYLRRKQKKHLPYIELLRPSVPAVLRAYELRNPQRVGFLREDSLAHMLTLSNVQSGMRVLCLDQSGGLLAAAVLERLGPSGLLLLAHTQEQPPPLPLLRHFNALPLERLRRVSLHEVLAGREAEAPACSLEAVLGQLGGLEACALLSALEPLMAPSAALALFSPFPEALRDAYERLLRSGGWVRVQLHETWLRAYQVLPDRTHPHMQMHGASGFLLTALRVLPAPLAVPTPTPAPALLSPEAVPASVSAAPASAPPPTVNDVAASPSVAFPSGNDGEPSDTSGSGCEPPLKRARNP